MKNELESKFEKDKALRLAIQVMDKFTRKVENGQARSVETYTEQKHAIRICRQALNFEYQYEAYKDPIIQEKVFKELGTYEKLQELHVALDSANKFIGTWQPIIDGLQELTGQSNPFRLYQEIKRLKEKHE